MTARGHMGDDCGLYPGGHDSANGQSLDGGMVGLQRKGRAALLRSTKLYL
jgi:hypothetical protein